jgi:plastocyanin
LLLLALVGLGALSESPAGMADEPTVETAETASGFVWRPSAVTAAPGGTVAFRNPGNLVPHGVRWTGGPEPPSCSGVPVDDFGTSWSGTCTFSQAGTYAFVCTVHPEEMKGTITVASGEAPAPTAPAPGQPPAPTEDPIVGALRLAKSQHGGAVRGSIAVASAAVGGGMVVELDARRASLGGKGGGMVRVGKLSRSLSRAGQQLFAVPLTDRARRTLRSRDHLSLRVGISVTPPGGLRTTMTRGIELHE